MSCCGRRTVHTMAFDTLMQYGDPEAMGHYRTPTMPSGQDYVFTGMPDHPIWVFTTDVEAMLAFGFVRVDLPELPPEQEALVTEAAQAAETQAKTEEAVAQAVTEANSADEPKSSRRK